MNELISNTGGMVIVKYMCTTGLPSYESENKSDRHCAYLKAIDPLVGDSPQLILQVRSVINMLLRYSEIN